MKELRPKTLLVFILVCLLIAFLDSKDVLLPFKSALSVVTAPVQYNLYSFRNSVADTFSVFIFWKSGEARIRDLEMRNAELIASVSQLSGCQEENNSLRSQLGIKALLAKKMVMAPVLGLSRYLEIGVGKSSGVALGQTVVSQNSLVGRIVKMNLRTSFVELPTDADAKIPVIVGGSFVKGLVVGQFSSAMMLTRVAQNEQINSGDPVVTSGEGETYERGMLLGKVGKINSAETDLFRQAGVVPSIDYGRLGTVFVVVGND